MRKTLTFFMTFCFIGIILRAQTGISTGGNTPDPSAILDVVSSSSGLLIPRMTLAWRNAINAPVEGLMVVCTNCGVNGATELCIFRSEAWHIIPKEPQWSCGMPFTVYHRMTDVAPLNKSVQYGTVTGITGEMTKCWITQNLGAARQATAINDNTEASAGWYWQFNRKKGYRHDGVSLTPVWLINSINENSDWTNVNDPCNLEIGPAWRIPTYSEWFNVDNAGAWVNNSGPWNSPLKMHGAGFLAYGTGNLGNRGSYGDYWSSTQAGSTIGWDLNFGGSSCGMVNNRVKAYGFSIRCLRN